MFRQLSFVSKEKMQNEVCANRNLFSKCRDTDEKFSLFLRENQPMSRRFDRKKLSKFLFRSSIRYSSKRLKPNIILSEKKIFAEREKIQIEPES